MASTYRVSARRSKTAPRKQGKPAARKQAKRVPEELRRRFEFVMVPIQLDRAEDYDKAECRRRVAKALQSSDSGQVYPSLGHIKPGPRMLVFQVRIQEHKTKGSYYELPSLVCQSRKNKETGKYTFRHVDSRLTTN